MKDLCIYSLTYEGGGKHVARQQCWRLRSFQLSSMSSVNYHTFNLVSVSANISEETLKFSIVLMCQPREAGQDISDKGLGREQVVIWVSPKCI